MLETTIGVRDLKTHLSRHLETVKQGGMLVITEHGKPIGRILPFVENAQAATQEMINSGLAAWSGKKPAVLQSGPVVTGKRSLADLLLEDRE